MFSTDLAVVIVTRPGVNLSVAQLTQAMASLDPNLPLIWIRPLSEQVANLFRQQRLIARLTDAFGKCRCSAAFVKLLNCPTR